MPVPSFTVGCVRNDIIATDIYEFVLEKPANFTFKPGQFVLFDVPLVDHPSDIQARAFSLGSTPTEDGLLFVAKFIPEGRASKWLKNIIRHGSEVMMKGPFGNFTLDRATAKGYVFIATGTGVAPFRSQIKDTLETGDKRRMDLIFGVRSEEDLFWQEELIALTQQYDNFYLHLALSNPSDTWVGHRGRVQTLVPQIIHDFATKNIYVCGSPDMTTELKKLCLEEWKVPREDLHVEGYI